MKMRYEEPEMEFVEFGECVITSSGDYGDLAGDSSTRG